MRQLKVERLSDILDRIAHRADGAGALTLGDLISAVGRRSYGPLLLFIGVFAISPITAIPGLTWVAAVLTLVIAGQMALGMRRIWLPRRVLATPLPRGLVSRSAAAGQRWAKGIDHVFRPRLLFMSQPPFVTIVALCCIAAALVTFPLGFIPFGPLAPSAAVVLFGLGMAARDGLWLLAGMGLIAGTIWLAKALIF